MTGRKAFSLGAACRDARGVAAVEFAIVAPLLIAMVLAIAQYGGLLVAHQQMHNGVAAGAMYVMRGGSDTTAIHDIALSAWPGRPADASISVSQSCSCAGATVDCANLCPDNVTYPQAFTVISASGTYSGLLQNQSLSAAQTVRTQ